MIKNFFGKIKQEVSRRLLLLRKKVNWHLFQKYALLLHSRLQMAKEKLVAWIAWLRLKLGAEAMKSYAQTASAWFHRWLGREALKTYTRTVCDWTKRYLNREALKKYALTAACWLRELPKKLTWENIKAWSIAAWHWLCNLPDTLRALRKNALLVSCALLALWLLLGTTTTLAWFTDATPTARNEFVIGKMDLDVYYKNDVETEYIPMTEDSPVFNDQALYEPGYTQVVYLRIENNGDIAFDYMLSATVHENIPSTNVYGEDFTLPPYLKYGVIFGASEEALNRELARQYAGQKFDVVFALDQHSSYDDVTVEPGKNRFAAIIVYMPETVGNEANHITEVDPPQVTLGITVYAQQEGTMTQE